MPFPGSKDGLRWVLADVELSGDVPDADIASMWSRSGILLLFRYGENVWRIVAEETLPDPESPRRAPTLEEIQQHLDVRGAANVRASKPKWLAEFRVSERKVENYRSGRVFLAGDAAHVHSPAGGQGMNTGIQDACNLAWKLAWVLRGFGSEQLLESYSNERSEVGAMVVRTTSHMTRIATTESRVLQSVRNAVAKIALHFEWVQDKVMQRLAEYTVSYRGNLINGIDSRRGKARLKCGDRVPNIQWKYRSDRSQKLYQQLSGGVAVLLMVSPGPLDASEPWGHNIQGGERSFETIELIVVDNFSIVQGVAGRAGSDRAAFVQREEIEKLNLGTGGWVIVRPDGYLAAVGECDEMQAVYDWLAKVAAL